MNSKKLLLIIMDGWGEGEHNHANAIYSAKTPFIKSLYNNPDVAYCQLNASGLAVGLPEGQMGNSEVGHLNFGAGRIVYQDLVRISKAVEDGSIGQNKVLCDAYKYAKENNKAVHFIGLISDGGVHSLQTHLYKLCDIARDHGLEKVFIHAITDGRDTDPHSGLGYLKELQDHLAASAGKIATLIGRYYTMDRDKRWERIKTGYDMMVHGTGKKSKDVLQATQESYDEGVTDEFIKPVVFTDDNGKPLTTIQQDDVVICFNFRTDRLREITTVLTQKDMPEAGMQNIPLHYLTMTRYDESFKKINIIFEPADLKQSLAEVLSKLEKKQLRIAETEKYPHVTFFFSGGQETPFDGEDRMMVPSPKVATYDLQPEMSAPEVTVKVVEAINKNYYDFICLNYANADMVGHTGVYPAIIKALETVDTCVEKVIKTALENDYSVILTADHGNSDMAENPDGSPNTAHTCNPVPCFLFDRDYKTLHNGKLADIAPTILKIMNLPQPEEMTGNILV
ncbi:MAG TPA: 2,3-bisphosphoglycerate-independent phosphoglycerate mutase [Bacteroidales bacterium]|nr:2,3-bisphosphoglycerate-independent phosphoglycerate mutase [Bacteroidales bacterium]